MNRIKRVPVAQLDRVTDSDSVGHGFESHRVRQTNLFCTAKEVSLILLRTEAVKNHIKSNLNHCRKILERTELLMDNRQTRRKATGNHGGSSAEGNLSKETETGLFLQP